MPKYINVQLFGRDSAIPTPLRIRADRIEKDQHGKMVLTVGETREQVGEFMPNTVQGWWIEDEEAAI